MSNESIDSLGTEMLRVGKTKALKRIAITARNPDISGKIARNFNLEMNQTLTRPIIPRRKINPVQIA